MNSPERLPSETHKPITGYLWGALAVLTCPCHLPILAIVLAGTTAGAFIGEYWGIAALTLTGLFVLSVTRLLRAFKDRSCALPIETNHAVATLPHAGIKFG
ncbi:broad-spectrum mercury transporter MerE [Burkholderia gladioli]|nr:broad-spectrum mercury transporter MerE [Burkholderia gladioli]SPV21502.1 putative mercury resistance protein [Burkholderia gladioli]